MNFPQFHLDTSFYTHEHEWINFDGRYAYVGVCPFKLTGLSLIDRVEFCNSSIKQERGALIATLISGDYEIKIHMPVEGWVIDCNTKLISEPGLVKAPGKKSWIAKIMPAAPYSRTDLLSVVQYKQIVGKGLKHEV